MQQELVVIVLSYENALPTLGFHPTYYDFYFFILFLTFQSMFEPHKVPLSSLFLVKGRFSYTTQQLTLGGQCLLPPPNIRPRAMRAPFKCDL